MIVKLDDGRIFKTEKIIQIIYYSDEKVYRYKIVTKSLNAKSSERHKWVVWNKNKKELELIEMKKIDKNIHEILIMENEI
jgi:hypothetical protein